MSNKARVIEGLNQLLADATVFYQKLRHYHWTVSGRHFYELHVKFEALYTLWADAVDQIAERILMLDGIPLHTLASMLHEARLVEDETVPAAQEMVAAIHADLLRMHTEAGEVIGLAEEAGDRGTANVLDALRDTMEKDMWMLEAWGREPVKAWS
jgi:starvation-inducible DNA-binding protein